MRHLTCATGDECRAFTDVTTAVRTIASNGCMRTDSHEHRFNGCMESGRSKREDHVAESDLTRIDVAEIVFDEYLDKNLTYVLTQCVRALPRVLYAGIT